MKWIEQWNGFEWDEGNSSKNLLKHGISIEECEQAFFSDPLLIADDTSHSELEERQNALGITRNGKPLFVSFTIRNNRVRPISFRKMSRRERRIYADEAAKKDS
jgi:hypothetical protein